MDATTLDQPCEVCGMSHGHHTSWCVSGLKPQASHIPPQGKLHSDLHPDTRLKPSPAGINAEGPALIAKDVPIGQPK